MHFLVKRSLPIVAALFLAPACATAACPGGYSESLVVNGAVANAARYTLSDLQAMPPTRATVNWYSGREGSVTGTYIGVPLFDLITAAGVITNPAQKNDQLRASLVVTATDCYQVTIALAEILPQFGGQQALVAYADGDGVPLGADEGVVRVIMPGDKAGGRSVVNARSIQVRIPTTAPQASD